MKVLFSSIGTTYKDGQSVYYDSAIVTQLERYSILGEELSLLANCVETNKPKGVLQPQNSKIRLYPLYKINSLRKLAKSKSNDQVIKDAVSNCDLLICHVHSFTARKAIKYAHKMNKPYMTVVVNCPWDAYWNYDWRGKLIAPFGYLSLKQIQRDVTHSIYVTKHFLQNRYPTKGVQLGASDVDIPKFEENVLDLRMARIDQLSNDNRHFEIATVAALIPYKGQKYVIEAIAKLKKLGFEYIYHVIGDGDMASLKELVNKLQIQNQVIFHGRINHDQVFSILDSVDIYIQPSKQEGLPRAMVEAMSRGCVPMGSNIAGIPELCENKFLFPKGDVGAIVRILSSVTKQELMQHSRIAIEKSKEYDSAQLQQKYRDFLVDFRHYCENIVNKE